MFTLSDSQKKTVLAIIDRGEWKHSWHLPSNGYGTDWRNPETLEKCITVLTEMKADAESLIRRIETVDVACVQHLETIKKRLADDAE